MIKPVKLEGQDKWRWVLWNNSRDPPLFRVWNYRSSCY